MIRFFDILFSFLGLILLLPVFLIIAILISLDSKGGVFYTQERAGRHYRYFRLVKFRTMRPDSDRKGGLTVGSRDPRITRTGYVLRKYKLDELPQLLNVLMGEMSMVGPRPEIRRFAELYTSEQRKVLEVRPGITDIASMEFIDENELLAESTDPEKTYIEKILPAKLEMNKTFIEDQSLANYFRIIGLTLRKICR